MRTSFSYTKGSFPLRRADWISLMIAAARLRAPSELALRGLRRGRPARRGFQSLLATASLNRLEPYAWLRSTLEKLPVWPHN